MKTRHAPTLNHGLGDVRAEMSPSRRIIAQTAVGFDRNSAACREVAREFEAVAASLDRRLAAALAPIPVDVDNLARTLDVVRPEVWPKLAETMFVFVPRGPSRAHQPGLTLIMPARIAGDHASRGAMRRQLAQVADAYSSLVVVFIESDGGSKLPDGWEERTWRTWLNELSEDLPSSVARYYLVGRTASDGRLLAAADQTAVAAHAVLADIVVRDRETPRYLAQSLKLPEVSVGALGMSGHLASAEAASKCLARPLCVELVREVQTDGTGGDDLPEGLPTDPFQGLVQAFRLPMPFDATAALDRADSRERSDYESPSLVGFQSRFSVDVGKAAKTLNLDDVPASLWRARLAELNALISSDRAQMIAARACEALDQERVRDEQRIQDALRHAFASHLKEEPLRAIGDSLLRRIERHRGALVVAGAPEMIEEALNRMDACIRRAGCWRNGVKSVSLSLLVAIAIIWACQSWASGPIRVWGTVLPSIGVVATALAAAGRWAWARHLALQSRDDVLEKIQRRAQLVICERLRQKLEDVANRLCDVTTSSVTALTAAARDIAAVQRPTSNRTDDQQSLIERPRANGEDMQGIYRFVTQRPSAYGSLVDKFRERCRDLADDLTNGRVAANHALSSLREFLVDELMLVLNQRMDIWRLYCEDNTANSFDDATFLRRIQAWAEPVFCGTGSMLAQHERCDVAAKTCWICPDTLASRVVGQSGAALLPMDDRILALHQLTLTAIGAAHEPRNERGESGGRS